MDTIIGKVLSVDPSGDGFTVVATTHGRRGRVTTKRHKVRLSAGTTFISKGKRKVISSATKIKPGVTVIARLVPSRLGIREASEVWHQTVSGGAIYLTATECKNLGGTVEKDLDCPSVGPGPGTQTRCKTAGGSQCIDEAVR